MKSVCTSGSICLDSKGSIRYLVAKIDFTEYEDGTFRYEIWPNWPVIDLLESPLFQGIPGIDLTLRRDVYVRENQIPVFVSERAPAPNREGLWEQLEAVGMDYFNQLEWLIRTDTRYIGDELYVVRRENEDMSPFDLNEAMAMARNTEHLLRMLLEALAQGRPVIQAGVEVSSEQRKALHSLARGLFDKSWSYREERRRSGIKRASAEGSYRGRRPIAIDQLVLSEVLARYEEGSLSAKDAADMLGVSLSTFYRRLSDERRKVKS